jgi:hypothetical protein
MTIAKTGAAAGQEPFLLETVATDTLIGGSGDGPVALTCNCYGSCQGGLCGSCCTIISTGHTVLEI